MPNIGHTTIEATGSPQELTALAAHVRGTVRGGSAFTLSGLMHPDPAPDHAVRWAELGATDGIVSLFVGITYDRDALGIAARIAGLPNAPHRHLLHGRVRRGCLRCPALRQGQAGLPGALRRRDLLPRVRPRAGRALRILGSRDGAFVLLTGMDCCGGYGHEERLAAAAAARRLSEPAETRSVCG